jgi:hypothetical protein
MMILRGSGLLNNIATLTLQIKTFSMKNLIATVNEETLFPEEEFSLICAFAQLNSFRMFLN